MIRPCNLCGGDGYQVGPPTPCPRCADMPWLMCPAAHFDDFECPTCHDRESKTFKPERETVRYWCFTHDAPWYDFEGMCYRAMAEAYHQGFKVFVGPQFKEAIGTCDDCDWVERSISRQVTVR